MGAVGFVSFDDFCNDLAEYAHPTFPVRVQRYHHARQSDNLPITHYTFFLEAAHENSYRKEVFVCRFRVGSVSVMGDLPQERERLTKLEQRTQQLHDTLTNRLRQVFINIGLPVKIRPGLIAAAAESKTEASLESLINGLAPQGLAAQSKATGVQSVA